MYHQPSNHFQLFLFMCLLYLISIYSPAITPAYQSMQVLTPSQQRYIEPQRVGWEMVFCCLYNYVLANKHYHVWTDNTY